MERAQTKLCLGCQEFFGSQERKGYCSVCFADFKPKEKRTDSLETTSSETEITQETPVTREVEEVKVEVTVDPKTVQSNPLNCWKCDRRVGYMGFKCNCGYVFCGTHRHFRDHECTFDFKSHDRSKMKKFEGFKEKQNIK